MLACLASQPDEWPWLIDMIPGDWNEDAKHAARKSIHLVDGYAGDLVWRERYAEAEARLRSGEYP